MLEGVKIEDDKITCNRCEESFSLKRTPVTYNLCQCKTLRLVRCNTHIEVSHMGKDQSIKINYYENR